MSDIKSLLARHEGVRRFAYDDTTGKPVPPGTTIQGKITVDVGRNLVDTGLSADEISYLLRNDIERCRSELDRALPWWRRLSEARRQVLISMCFNLSIAGLLAFKRMLAACERGDHTRATDEMLASRWARQVGGRAEELARMMREG